MLCSALTAAPCRNCGHASIWRPHGRDAAAASRLWTLSEELTGTNYGL